MPSVKSILGQEIIGISTFEQDTEEATDLVILTTRASKIACRIRDYNKYKLFINEFTIRSRSQYGGRTEIHKILEGLADWMFYGFGENEQVVKYSIIDLDVFRKNYELVTPTEKKNHDGTEFFAFDIGRFPSDILIKSDISIQFGLEEVHPCLQPFPTHG